MAGFVRDDNNVALATPGGLRPKGIAAGVISVTLSGTTQELAMPVTSSNAQGDAVVRVFAGAQGAYYAFNAAGAGALHTGITNMVALPPNWVEYVKVKSTDAKVYAIQLGTAGTFQVTVLE